MAARFSISRRRYSRRKLLAIFTSLVLTGGAWYAVKMSVDLYDAARFEAAAKEVRDDIAFQMQTYINALIQTAGMFHVSERVTREEFREYLRATQLLEKYPGIQGVGFAARVPAAKLKRHIAEVRRSGFPDYQVWPDTPRPEYFTIVYLEPFDWRNQRAFGYDMYTEPKRQAAMAAARDSGQPAATAPVRLVQETQVAPQPGFLIYVPLYRRDTPLDTVAQRRAALLGFIYSPFRAHDLFGEVFSSKNANAPVYLEIFDGAAAAADSLLYDYDGLPHLAGTESNPRFLRQFDLDVAGRPWRLVAYAKPGFGLSSARWLPSAVLAIGLLVTLLLGATLRANRKELESSRRAELLLESMSDGVSVSDDNGTILYTNRAEDAMFGYAPGELIGQHVSVQNRYPSAENERVVSNVMHALKERGEWSGEFQNRKKDGTPFTTYARINAMEVDGRRHLVCVQRDVTELKRAEQALHESEARFRHVADEAPIMIWMAGPDRRCYYFNRSWLDFTGRTHEQESGDGWMRGVHPEDCERYLQIYRSAFDARVPFEVEYRLRRHDGEYRWVLDRGVPRFTADRQFLGYIGSCIDIAERKQFEQTLQEAIKARDAFLSVVSHELRTPITTLKLQAQIRKKSLEAGRIDAFTEDKLTKMIDIDNRQIDRLHRLVDEMLDISRIGAGRLAMQREQVDVCALTREVIERLEPQCAAAGCSVNLTCAGPLIGVWDHFRLEQVLVNLLTNATKYGAGQPIDVAVNQRGDHAVIEVRDRGIGIAPQDQQRIFERYERIASVDRIGGLGVGLYIVRQIVEAHGGNVRVCSALGEGARFIVELPIAVNVANDTPT